MLLIQAEALVLLRLGSGSQAYVPLLAKWLLLPQHPNHNRMIHALARLDLEAFIRLIPQLHQSAHQTEVFDILHWHVQELRDNTLYVKQLQTIVFELPDSPFKQQLKQLLAECCGN